MQDPLRGFDLRVPSHVGGSTLHAHGRRHLRHADAERIGGERRLRRRRLARRGGHLHREVLHRGRTSPGLFCLFFKVDFGVLSQCFDIAYFYCL